MFPGVGRGKEGRATGGNWDDSNRTTKKKRKKDLNKSHVNFLSILTTLEWQRAFIICSRSGISTEGLKESGLLSYISKCSL